MKSEPWRCRHPDCIYHTTEYYEQFYGCNYLLMTGHSRIKGLSPAEAWPCNCKEHVSRSGRKKRPAAERKSTEREQWRAEARKLNAKGYTNSEIAKKLGLIRQQVDNYFGSAGIRAVRLADLHGWDWHRAESLWRGGANDETVAETIGCDLDMIRRYRQRKEITGRKGAGER